MHEDLRPFQPHEAVPLVEPAGVGSRQHLPTQTLELGVREHDLDEPFPQSPPTVHLQHERVPQVGEGSAVGDKHA